MKRRALALLCAGILAVGMLTGCGSSSDKKDGSTKTEETKKAKKKRWNIYSRIKLYADIT